jgi:hypothetical protein
LSVTVPSTRAHLSEAAGHLVPRAAPDARRRLPLKVPALRLLGPATVAALALVRRATHTSIAFHRRRPPASLVHLPLHRASSYCTTNHHRSVVESCAVSSFPPVSESLPGCHVYRAMPPLASPFSLFPVSRIHQMVPPPSLRTSTPSHRRRNRLPSSTPSRTTLVVYRLTGASRSSESAGHTSPPSSSYVSKSSHIR